MGVDIANVEGSKILAPADGEVTLVENMELSGHTLMIDHGYGLRSTLMHLNTIHVQLGQKVRQGEWVADMGKTGRATGSHLHWGMSWFTTRLDPALALGISDLRKGTKVSPADKPVRQSITSLPFQW